jgi:hypothetical protein
MLSECRGNTRTYQSDFQHFGKSPPAEAAIVPFFRPFWCFHIRHAHVFFIFSAKAKYISIILCTFANDKRIE